MNILQVSVHDHGGAAYYLAQAINAATEHKATSVRQAKGSYIQYPIDLVAEKPGDLVGVWEWADMVHVHDICPKLPRGLKPKPTVVTYHGSMYRKAPKTYNDMCESNNWIGTVATVDLMAHGLPWMPDTRPDLSGYVDRPKGRFIVAHAPTSRAVKSTDAIAEMLDEVDGLALDIIERVDNETCLRRKGRASVYVDQFRLCYGLNAIEGWSMAMPAIANASKKTVQRIKKEMGFLPFVQSTLGNLQETVLRLRDDQEFYSDGVARGRQAIREIHGPGVAAARALAYYEEAFEMKAAPLPVAADDKPRSLSKLPAGALDIGREGLVLVRYIGGNVGTETVQGAVTGTGYKFPGVNSVRYMDARDWQALETQDKRVDRKSGKNRGKRQYRRER